VINFRYHIVSLTAVFLALAIGLIVGTAALNGPLSDELKNQVTQLRAQNQQYRSQVSSLKTEENQKEQFAQQIAPIVLAGKLTNHRVLIVTTKNADADLKSMTSDLSMAGATVTGHIEMEDTFVSSTENDTLLDLVSRTVAIAPISNLPTNSNGVESATAMLAAVLMDHTPTIDANAQEKVLTAFETAGYLKCDAKCASSIHGAADVVVVLGGLAYTDQNAPSENQNVVTMVDQFDKAGPIVVGASSTAGSGNVIAAIRGDASLSKTVSTVDNDNTLNGLLAITLALNEQLGTGKAGHYGLASSATALLPKFPQS
jgi:hypothetical protein